MLTKCHEDQAMFFDVASMVMKNEDLYEIRDKYSLMKKERLSKMEWDYENK